MIKERTVKRRTSAKDTGKRYEVRYRDPDGKERSRTFLRKGEAEVYERKMRSALDHGGWIDPRHATVTFKAYSDQYLGERTDLRPRTEELYRSLLRRHILPTFGTVPLGKITTNAVRIWNGEAAEKHPITAAKAYRLLRQIMSAAVVEEKVSRNPCVVKGAGQEHSAERPMLTHVQIAALTAAMPPEMRIAVTLACVCQLRRGEVLGLERRDVNPLHKTIRVERTANQLRGGLQLGPPKTEAGRRTVVIPSHALPELEAHLAAYVGTEDTSPLLVGSTGARLNPRALDGAWGKARASITGLEDVHFHDLRHAGATFYAPGATLKELQARLGHASPAAAMRYQHATAERDAVLADAMSERMVAAKVTPISGAGGVAAG